MLDVNTVPPTTTQPQPSDALAALSAHHSEAIATAVRRAVAESSDEGYENLAKATRAAKRDFEALLGPDKFSLTDRQPVPFLFYFFAGFGLEEGGQRNWFGVPSIWYEGCYRPHPVAKALSSWFHEPNVHNTRLAVEVVKAYLAAFLVAGGKLNKARDTDEQGRYRCPRKHLAALEQELCRKVYGESERSRDARVSRELAERGRRK